MNINIKNKLWHASKVTIVLALTSGCNTSETGFYIGDLEDVTLTSNLTNPEIRLAADGASQEIDVISNVKWELVPPEHPFSAVATTTEGNGVIKVSSTNNFNTSSTRTSELTVRAVDFSEKFFKVTLHQSQLLFQMEDQNYPITPQEGGEVSIRFNSSVNWKFDVKSGSSEWLQFNPGITGKGEWSDIKVTALWTPNYTTSERSVSLELAPSDSIWLESVASIQKSFSLVQEAGTLPTDIILTPIEAGKTSVTLSLSYASKAPVEKVEIKVTDMTSDKSRSFSVPKNSEETEYPLSGVLSFTIPDLDPGVPYILTPSVISKVGESIGDPKRMQTQGDIEFKLPFIEDDGFEIIPSYTGVEAFFKTVSEIELTSFNVALCQTDDTVLATQSGKINSVLDPTGAPISWIAELTWNNNVTLSQNTSYYFKLTITGNNPNIPDQTNTIHHDLGNFHFTTPFRQPEQDDNHPLQ